MSLPDVGAWMKLSHGHKTLDSEFVAPPCGRRGLNTDVLIFSAFLLSLPVWERGLKMDQE